METNLRNVTSLLHRRTEVSHRTQWTLRTPGDAGAATMRDDEVIHGIPSLAVDKFHQLKLNRHSIRGCNHPQEIHDACHMCVDSDAGDVEAVRQHAVCRLSSDASERDELVERRWYL